MSSVSDTDFASSVPIIGGLIYGVLAYVVALITSILYLFTKRPETGNELSDIYQFEVGGSVTGTEIAINAIGWLFYNVQMVPLQVTGRDGSEVSVNLIEEMGVGDPLVSAIPVVVLVVFGIILAQRSSATSTSSGLISGATLVVGYGVLATVGALFFGISDQGVTFQLPLANAIMIVGIAYPMIGGGIGGLIKGILT